MSACVLRLFGWCYGIFAFVHLFTFYTVNRSLVLVPQLVNFAWRMKLGGVLLLFQLAPIH